MKANGILLFFALVAFPMFGQELNPIQLKPHSTSKDCDIMKAFQQRQSTREFDPKAISLQDLSDLLWAANGINRPESGKKTAPSAMNAQDVDIYVCTAEGAYLFDAAGNSLKPIVAKDLRPLMDGGRPSGAPTLILLVADLSKNRSYQPNNAEANKHIYEMSALDAGIVSQNISLFCASAGLGTVPRYGMDQAGLKSSLNLKASQILWLNHPVGYFKAR
jgi:nitroreductase